MLLTELRQLLRLLLIRLAQRRQRSQGRHAHRSLNLIDGLDQINLLFIHLLFLNILAFLISSLLMRLAITFKPFKMLLSLLFSLFLEYIERGQLGLQ